MNVTQVVILAVLAEAVLEALKPVWEADKRSVDRLAALAISVLLAVAAGVDLFAAVGLPLQVPIVGAALTGIIGSRGAGVLHDLFRKLEARPPTTPAA